MVIFDFYFFYGYVLVVNVTMVIIEEADQYIVAYTSRFIGWLVCHCNQYNNVIKNVSHYASMFVNAVLSYCLVECGK